MGTIPQVIALSELVAPRFRALLLLAAFTASDGVISWPPDVAT